MNRFIIFIVTIAITTTAYTMDKKQPSTLKIKTDVIKIKNNVDHDQEIKTTKKKKLSFIEKLKNFFSKFFKQANSNQTNNKSLTLSDTSEDSEDEDDLSFLLASHRENVMHKPSTVRFDIKDEHKTDNYKTWQKKQTEYATPVKESNRDTFSNKPECYTESDRDETKIDGYISLPSKNDFEKLTN